MQTLTDAVIAARAQLGSRPNVASIEAGYRFKGGWITHEPCIAVSVTRKLLQAELYATEVATLPHQIAEFPVDVRTSQLGDSTASLLETLLAARKPVCNSSHGPICHSILSKRK